MDRRVNLWERLRSYGRLHSARLLGAGLFLLLLQDIVGTHGLLAMRRSRKEVQEIREEIDRLNTENQKLQELVRELKFDPAAVERIAREEMGLARPGELIFKLPPKQPGTPNGKSSSAPPKK